MELGGTTPFFRVHYDMQGENASFSSALARHS